MALADKISNNSERYIYAMLSDGEHDEGNTWEGIMLGAKYKLNNLIAIVDRNHIQIDGNTEDIMPLGDLKIKWESFNWHVQEVDGHNFRAMEDAINEAKSVSDKPSVIIAITIPGRGVKEFERDYKWHGKPPNYDEADMALKELRTLGGKIISEHQ